MGEGSHPGSLPLGHRVLRPERLPRDGHMRRPDEPLELHNYLWVINALYPLVVKVLHLGQKGTSSPGGGPFQLLPGVFLDLLFGLLLGLQLDLLLGLLSGLLLEVMQQV